MSRTRTPISIPLEHFVREELAHPDQLSPDVLRRLDLLRELLGEPIYVTSGYRPGDPLAHGQGVGLDLSQNPKGTGKKSSSAWRFKVVGLAYRLGFRRIGVYDIHVHLDLSTTLSQDVLWVGKSS